VCVCVCVCVCVKWKEQVTLILFILDKSLDAWQ
jgi:hypothetical protein